MSDLISKSKTIELLYQVFEKYSMATDKNDPLCGFGAELFKNIKAMPTAYSVDRVVEELRKNASRYTKKYVTPYGNNGYKDTKAISIHKAIDIVKRGGKE